jgi:hypothetical protein
VPRFLASPPARRSSGEKGAEAGGVELPREPSAPHELGATLVRSHCVERALDLLKSRHGRRLASLSNDVLGCFEKAAKGLPFLIRGLTKCLSRAAAERSPLRRS